MKVKNDEKNIPKRGDFVKWYSGVIKLTEERGIVAKKPKSLRSHAKVYSFRKKAFVYVYSGALLKIEDNKQYEFYRKS